MELDFGGLTVELVATDGRAFLDTANYSGLRGTAQPVALSPQDSLGPVTPAERYDMIVNSESRPAEPGVYTVTVRFLHWITNDLIGTAMTTITIN